MRNNITVVATKIDNKYVVLEAFRDNLLFQKEKLQFNDANLQEKALIFANKARKL